MKKLLLLALLLTPFLTHADIAATWQATSTTAGTIFPSKINGTIPAVQANRFIATSTTQNSDFVSANVSGLLTAPNIHGTSITQIGTSNLVIGQNENDESSLTFDVPTENVTLYTNAGNIFLTTGAAGSLSIFQNGTVTTSANLGVGTTTPGTIISAGTGTNYFNLSNTATSTFSHTVRATCFSTNGTTCLTSGVTPGGSDMNIQFNNGGTSLGGDNLLNWQTSNEQFKIGDPTSGFANDYMSFIIYSKTLGTDYGAIMGFDSSRTGGRGWYFQSADINTGPNQGQLIIGVDGNGHTIFSPDIGDGSYGVGINNGFSPPVYNLDVNGTGHFTADLLVDTNVGIGTSPAASLDVARGSGSDGTAVFHGTTNASNFNFSSTEDTYIRGGKSTSALYLNDTASGNVYLANGGGNVGIGTTTPPDLLSIEMTTVPSFVISNQGSSTPAVTVGGINQNGRSGFGTTTPFAQVSIQSNNSTSPVFAAATTTTKTLLLIDQKGNEYVGGDQVTASSCGTNPVVATSSNNNVGRVKAGTGIVSSCTVNFADAGWTITPNAPACFANSEGGVSVALYASSTPTTLVITGATFTGNTFTYHCTGF